MMRRERIGGKGGSHVIGELSGSDPWSRGWDLVLRVRGWPRSSAAGPRVGRAECALVTPSYFPSLISRASGASGLTG